MKFVLLLVMGFLGTPAFADDSMCASSIRGSLGSLQSLASGMGYPELTQFVSNGDSSDMMNMDTARSALLKAKLRMNSGTIKSRLSSCNRACDGASDGLVSLCNDLSQQDVSSIGNFISQHGGVRGYSAKVSNVSSRRRSSYEVPVNDNFTRIEL